MSARRNTSKADTNEGKLTPQQAAAADLLASGQTVTKAAEAVGVSRQTVSGWLNREYAFQAEIGRRRGEVWDGACDRLRSLLPAALGVIERELQGNSVSAALAVIKAAGLHGIGAPTGPRTFEEVEMADRARAVAQRQRRFDITLGI
ncbi:MAG: hypothetical protein ACI91F_002842 [Candidatus Binatia bacterium]|jgi:hypothetical protein